jgi:hypothetical protein
MIKKFNQAVDRHLSEFVEYGIEGFKIAFNNFRFPFHWVGNIGECVFLLLCAVPVLLAISPFALINWLTGGDNEK